MNRRDMLKAVAGAAVLPMVKSAEVLRVQPNDTIVLTSTRSLTQEQRSRLRQHAEQFFPHNRVVVLEDGLDIKVVRA